MFHLINFHLKRYHELFSEAYFSQFTSIEKFTCDDYEISSFVKLGYSKEKNKKKLMFIHGWGSSASNWYFQVNSEELAPYDCYYVNLPGHGGLKDFENISQVTYEKYLLIISDYIKKLGLNKEDLIIIGHSLGGSLAKLLYERGISDAAIYINPAQKTIILPSKVISTITRVLNSKSNLLKYTFNKLINNSIVLNIWANKMGDNISPNISKCNTITISDMFLTKKNAFWGYLANMNNENPINVLFSPENLRKEYILFSKNDSTLPKEFKEYRSEKIFSHICGGHCLPRTESVFVNETLGIILKNI